MEGKGGRRGHKILETGHFSVTVVSEMIIIRSVFFEWVVKGRPISVGNT